MHLYCAFHVCCIRFFATPRTVARQPLLSMEFSRKKTSGLSFPSPGNLPDPDIESESPALQSDSLPSEPPRKPLCTLFLVLLCQRHLRASGIISWRLGTAGLN